MSQWDLNLGGSVINEGNSNNTSNTNLDETRD